MWVSEQLGDSIVRAIIKNILDSDEAYVLRDSSVGMLLINEFARNALSNDPSWNLETATIVLPFIYQHLESFRGGSLPAHIQTMIEVVLPHLRDDDAFALTQRILDRFGLYTLNDDLQQWIMSTSDLD